MSEMSFEQMLEESFKTIRNGEVVEGTVIDVKPDEIVLNIGYKSDGIITRNEYTNESNADLTTMVSVGDTMEAKVLKVNDGEGQVLLTYKRLAAEKGSKRLEEAFENKEVLTAKVSQVLDGGLCVVVDETRVFIPASVFDNKELLRNDPEYLASLSMLPTAEKKALLYGDWNSFTGQVFTEWRDDPEHYCDRRWTHVIAPFEIPRHWEIVRGFDFGYTRPFSVGWYAVDTKGCIYRIREYYGCTDKANEGIRLEPSVIAENIRKIERDDPNIRGRNVYGVADPSIFDKSRGESVADLMTRSPNFIIWSPGDNARISGKMQYHNRLAFNSDGEAMFYCFNTCREFIRTIPALMYDEKNVEDIDTTMEDHIYDECRYVLMEHPIAAPVKRGEIPAGDDPLEQRKPERAESFYMM